jgi:hypothetical protein
LTAKRPTVKQVDGFTRIIIVPNTSAPAQRPSSGGHSLWGKRKTKASFWNTGSEPGANGTIFFFAGIGINLLLYFTKPSGFDPSGSIFWGSFIGLAIPMTTMFVFVYIHKKMIGL